MPKYNLLKMTQLILSSMDGDEINSIDDTTEAQQVVDAIEVTYNNLASTLDFPDHWDLFELEPSGDTSRPTLMYLPSNCSKLEWVRYDCKESGGTVRNMKSMIPMDREQFFTRMNSLDSSKTDIYQYDYEVGTGTFDVRGKNDVFPTYYTTVDDYTLIFDNFDSSEGSTLQGNKTQCYGQLYPEFTRSDSFVADFDHRQFTLFFNEAKSLANTDLRQIENRKAEQWARRGLFYAHRKDPNLPPGNIKDTFTPNFGRRSRR